MARFLIGTVPVVGHVAPMVAIAGALVAAGHDLRWYTGEMFAPWIAETGAQFIPMSTGFDYSIEENISADLEAQREALEGLALVKFDLKTFFVDAAVGYTQDLLAILKDAPADVVLADTFFLAAGWAHELGGPPWAQLAVSALSFSSKDTAPYGMGLPPSGSLQGRLKNRALQASVKLGFRDVLSSINAAREAFNLEATDQLLFDTVSPYLHMATTVPEFEYPRSDLPPQVHFIGPPIAAPSAPFTPPDWWADLKGDRPVVHITQGTVATDPKDLLRPAIEALADEPLLVVVTTGNEPIADLGPLPDNVRAAEFIPHHDLLPHIDAMVTNGGYGGVQKALAQGIPLIGAGATQDKPEICARIAWAGVGLNLKTGSPKPKQIREAVRQLLTDASYRQNAQRLQAAIQACDPAPRAVALLEALATTQKPVLEATP